MKDEQHAAASKHQYSRRNSEHPPLEIVGVKLKYRRSLRLLRGGFRFLRIRLRHRSFLSLQQSRLLRGFFCCLFGLILRGERLHGFLRAGFCFLHPRFLLSFERIELLLQGLLFGELRLPCIVVGGEPCRVLHDKLSDILRIDREQERAFGVEDADVIFRALEASVFVRDLHLGDLRPEIAVLRVRLLHVVDKLGELRLMLVDVLERVHHHTRAVVVVLIILGIDLLVRHRKIRAHGVFVVVKIADAVEKRVGNFVVRLDDA